MHGASIFLYKESYIQVFWIKWPGINDHDDDNGDDHNVNDDSDGNNYNIADDDDDDDVYLESLQYGKGFHIIYSVYMSYVKHINPANEA
jgi:hypothetical protein